MAAATMPRAFWSGWSWRHLFDEIWDIRTIGFVPKPEPARL